MVEGTGLEPVRHTNQVFPEFIRLRCTPVLPSTCEDSSHKLWCGRRDSNPQDSRFKWEMSASCITATNSKSVFCFSYPLRGHEAKHRHTLGT